MAPNGRKDSDVQTDRQYYSTKETAKTPLVSSLINMISNKKQTTYPLDLLIADYCTCSLDNLSIYIESNE